MLIERTKVKRKESLLTNLGRFISVLSQGLTYLSDELQYEIVEKEVTG